MYMTIDPLPDKGIEFMTKFCGNVTGRPEPWPVVGLTGAVSRFHTGTTGTTTGLHRNWYARRRNRLQSGL